RGAGSEQDGGVSTGQQDGAEAGAGVARVDGPDDCAHGTPCGGTEKQGRAAQLVAEGAEGRSAWVGHVCALPLVIAGGEQAVKIGVEGGLGGRRVGHGATVRHRTWRPSRSVEVPLYHAGEVHDVLYLDVLERSFEPGPEAQQAERLSPDLEG